MRRNTSSSSEFGSQGTTFLDTFEFSSTPFPFTAPLLLALFRSRATIMTCFGRCRWWTLSPFPPAAPLRTCSWAVSFWLTEAWQAATMRAGETKAVPRYVAAYASWIPVLVHCSLQTPVQCHDDDDEEEVKGNQLPELSFPFPLLSFWKIRK